MATNPFSGVGLGRFGQELSDLGPGMFEEARAKAKKVAAIALLNGTGATGFLDNLFSEPKKEMGVPAPTVTAIKPPALVANNYVDDTEKIVLFNPFTVANEKVNLDVLSDHDIGNPYLEKYKE